MKSAGADLSCARGGGRLQRAGRRSLAVASLFLVLLSSGTAPVVAAPAAVESYTFTVTRCSSVYHRREFKGLLVADGAGRCRVTIYWLEPLLVCEKTDDLAYSDSIWTGDRATIWVHRGVEGEHVFRFDLGRPEREFRLPKDNALGTIMQSVLAALQSSRSDGVMPNARLEIAKFFEGCHACDVFEHRACGMQVNPPQNSESPTCDVSVMNSLPFGRAYRKRKLSDDTTVWQITNAVTGDEVVTLAVRPTSSIDDAALACAFDLSSLGTWPAVPEAYRKYWGFEKRWSQAKGVSVGSEQAKKLYADVRSCLSGALPREVDLALKKLHFDIALQTGDEEALVESARRYTLTFLGAKTHGALQATLELGRVAKKLGERLSRQQTHDVVRPLLSRLVVPAMFANRRARDVTVDEVKTRGWYWYGQLIVDVLREQRLVDDATASDYERDLETWRLSKLVTEPDPQELTSSMEAFLQCRTRFPPQGALPLEQLRPILLEGLQMRCSPSEQGRQFAEDVIGSIRLITGHGPFRADRERLTGALVGFDELYPPARVSADEAHDLLVTLLGLSFYDTSTKDDHRMLRSQLGEAARLIKTEIAEILGRFELADLVSEDDLEKAFEGPMRDLDDYVADPLWPMFKYPLTENERVRLVNKIRTRVGRLERLAERTRRDLKSGVDARVLAQYVHVEVASLARELPYRVLWVRLPRYPGVSCGYGGQMGLHVRLRGHFYEDVNQARDVFEVMKCFYLGHRLDSRTMGPQENGKKEKT